MPDQDGTATVDAGVAGDAPTQGSGGDVAELRQQVDHLTKQLETVQRNPDMDEVARRTEFDASAKAALAIIARMPDGVEKGHAKNQLGAAAIGEQKRRQDHDATRQAYSAAQNVALERERYIDKEAKSLGLSAAEADIIKAAAYAKNAQNSETVDAMLEPFRERAEARKATPPISRVRTDSGAASGGATPRTYEDFLRDAQERQAAGDRNIDLVQVRRNARAAGVAIPGSR